MYGVPQYHVSLEEYWQFMQVYEPFGYGVRNGPNANLLFQQGCGNYWGQRERYWLGMAMKYACERLEADRWLGFPVRRKYYNAEQFKPYVEPLYLGMHLRGVGVESEADIEAGVALTLSELGVVNDPVVFTVTVDFTDADDILIYYPGQREYTIRPSSITIDDVTATIEIPRVRLLKPEYFINYQNVNDRPDYTDDSYFLTTVDVCRNYLDTNRGSNVVWFPTSPCCCTGTCTCNTAEVRQAVTTYLMDSRLGALYIPNKTGFTVKRVPEAAVISYMKGYYDRYDTLDRQLIRAVACVAHNNMPQEPCYRCGILQKYYDDDTRPLEPAVSMGLGPSTWGIYNAVQIVKDFDHRRAPHKGGCL